MNQITFRWENYAKGVHEKKYREWKDDAGLYYTTKRPQDAGKFRTPPLRYVAFTAPYMHAGQFFTLEEVIDFYNDGGGENEFTERYGNKTPILKPLDLSDEEKEALRDVVQARTTDFSFPVVTDMDFGHTAPQFTLPLGCVARIDSEARVFEVLEPAVV